MTTILDYAESIIRLEGQAIQQADQGDLKGLRAAAESLHAIIRDCDDALTLSDLAEQDRAWLMAKRDKAASAMV